MADQAKLEASEIDERAELQQELDRREQEIVRLRDLLLVRDAELGAAKGRLAEIEGYWRLLSGGVLRLRARVSALVRFPRSALRRLRGGPRREGG